MRSGVFGGDELSSDAYRQYGCSRLQNETMFEASMEVRDVM